MSTPAPQLAADANIAAYNDFTYFAATRIRIKPKGGQAGTATGLVPLELNAVQRYVHERLEEQYERQGYIRARILKIRQPGISTMIQGRFYWHTTHAMDRTAMVYSYNDESTRNLFGMTKVMHQHDPLAPETKASNERALIFDNDQGTGLRSRYVVRTARGTKAAGRSFTLHYVHCSEVAWWEPGSGATIMSGTLESVPKEYPAILGTEVIWETTANGYDPLFQPAWEETENEIERAKAEGRAPETDWINIFVPWFWHTAYRLEISDDEREYILSTLTQYERWLLRQKRLDGTRVTTEQLAWRRKEIRDCTPPAGMTKEQFVQQEYPATALESFISTGRPVFDNLFLRDYLEHCPDPKHCYTLREGTGVWETDDEGPLRVWAEPEATVPYVISADVAEGLEHGDYSCADVLNHRSREQAATYHAHLPPKNFARTLYHLGKRYNWATIAVERNNHGLMVIQELLDMGYPRTRMYYELAVEHPGAKPRKRWGYYSKAGGGKSKTFIIDILAGEVNESRDDRNDVIGIRDRKTIEEMIQFERKVDQQTEYKQMGAREGKHDDRVMSIAIGKMVCKYVRLPHIEKSTESRFNDRASRGNPEREDAKRRAFSGGKRRARR